jgi:hypothetical protein
MKRKKKTEENFYACIQKKKKNQCLIKFTKNGLVINEQIRRIENI